MTEIRLDGHLGVETGNFYDSRGALSWTPPTSSIEGSTPTHTEGTPSYTESSSSGEMGMSFFILISHFSHLLLFLLPLLFFLIYLGKIKKHKNKIENKQNITITISLSLTRILISCTHKNILYIYFSTFFFVYNGKQSVSWF